MVGETVLLLLHEIEPAVEQRAEIRAAVRVAKSGLAHRGAHGSAVIKETGLLHESETCLGV